jgi:hypothetical protein
MLLMRGRIFYEKTGLWFKITAGPRQRSLSWIKVLQDSLPYFTVSDSRLPQPARPCPRNYNPQKRVVHLYPQTPRFIREACLLCVLVYSLRLHSTRNTASKNSCVAACAFISAIPVCLAVTMQQFPLLSPCHNIVNIWHVNSWGVIPALNIGSEFLEDVGDRLECSLVKLLTQKKGKYRTRPRWPQHNCRNYGLI